MVGRGRIVVRPNIVESPVSSTDTEPMSPLTTPIPEFSTNYLPSCRGREINKPAIEYFMLAAIKKGYFFTRSSVQAVIGDTSGKKLPERGPHDWSCTSHPTAYPPNKKWQRTPDATINYCLFP